MKGRKFRRIWGPSWDYCYLLAIEQRKLKEMAQYFQKNQLTVGWEIQVRDCQLCVNLLDIVLEKDLYYKNWLKSNYGPEFKLNKSHVIPHSKHINIRNHERFMSNILELQDKPRVFENLKVELRRKKAFHLYNKIRTYRMFSWWD